MSEFWRESDQPESPCYINLANTWIILNCGGGPTPFKPEIILEKGETRNLSFSARSLP